VSDPDVTISMGACCGVGVSRTVTRGSCVRLMVDVDMEVEVEGTESEDDSDEEDMLDEGLIFVEESIDWEGDKEERPEGLPLEAEVS
jgi:hypothetical protein